MWVLRYIKKRKEVQNATSFVTNSLVNDTCFFLPLILSSFYERMIGVKTVLTISPSSGSQFFLESLPRCWNSSRFNSSIVVRKNAILNHPRTLPGQQSPLYLVRPYYYRVGNKRNFTSLKNAKESDLKTSTSSGKASEMEGSATNIGAQQVVDSATSTNPTFLQRFLAPKEIPPRGSFGWYREMVLICTVFAITGSSTMMLVSSAL